MNVRWYVKRARELEEECRRRAAAEVKLPEPPKLRCRFPRRHATGRRIARAMKPGGHLHSVTLYLEAVDVQTSAAFYCDVLGFSLHCEVTTTSAHLFREGVDLSLSLPTDDGKARDPKRQFLYLNFTDIRGLFEHVRQCAGTYQVGSHTKGFLRPAKADGSFRILDPTGNHITLYPDEGQAVTRPGEPWIDPMNRDELISVRKLPVAIGCKGRFVVAMLRAGYSPQYPALGKTTARHALAALERVPTFRAQAYLKPGWKELPKMLALGTAS